MRGRVDGFEPAGDAAERRGQADQVGGDRLRGLGVGAEALHALGHGGAVLADADDAVRGLGQVATDLVGGAELLRSTCVWSRSRTQRSA